METFDSSDRSSINQQNGVKIEYLLNLNCLQCEQNTLIDLKITTLKGLK